MFPALYVTGEHFFRRMVGASTAFFAYDWLEWLSSDWLWLGLGITLTLTITLNLTLTFCTRGT